VILQAVGLQEDVDVELIRVPLRRGDRLLICSDGVTGAIADDELRSLVAGDQPFAVCRSLIRVANMRGGDDNATAIVVDVAGEILAAPDPHDAGPPHEVLKPYGAILNGRPASRADVQAMAASFGPRGGRVTGGPRASAPRGGAERSRRTTAPGTRRRLALATGSELVTEPIAPAPHEERPRVLLVDDDADFLARARATLADVTVVTATTPHEALVLLELQAFQTVLCGTRISPLEGRALLDVVRERWPETARVLVAGSEPARPWPRSVQLIVRRHFVLDAMASQLLQALER
jgi:CheY-like chemotaxis protein